MSYPNDGTHLSDWRDAAVDSRVVVRCGLDPDEARRTGRRWTDVIGVVVAVEPDGLTLRRDPARRSDPRDGAVVHVAGASVVAVRLLGPRPRPRRRDHRNGAPGGPARADTPDPPADPDARR
ncbi:hypothetical protein [Isoptericola dokdonensis]|uniref:Uncharacterized protein n=1 Tax=Isoptericola dokdonensis DS-3 TaxID=1300344 RepID=A0A161IKM2_9MICO|nr:hypothetical protein [Isoptericola dokdonensis]ANC30910.1 hypothetical protein I598_1351 [Isoptericola dokdonensis DS-3]